MDRSYTYRRFYIGWDDGLPSNLLCIQHRSCSRRRCIFRSRDILLLSLRSILLLWLGGGVLELLGGGLLRKASWL